MSSYEALPEFSYNTVPIVLYFIFGVMSLFEVVEA